jgi:HEAT repeat protein
MKGYGKDRRSRLWNRAARRIRKSKAIPHLLPLLKADAPVIRGDAAYLLGVIGNRDVVPFLNEIINDADMNVRMIVGEAIEDIAAASKSP